MQLSTCPRWAAPLSSFGVSALPLHIVFALGSILASASCRPLSDLDSARAGNLSAAGAAGLGGAGAAGAPSSAPALGTAGATGEQVDAGGSSLLPEATPPALPGSAVISDAAPPPDAASTAQARPDAAVPGGGSRGELGAPDALDAGSVGTPPSPVPPDAS
jgi:hypothetical protein